MRASRAQTLTSWGDVTLLHPPGGRFVCELGNAARGRRVGGWRKIPWVGSGSGASSRWAVDPDPHAAERSVRLLTMCARTVYIACREPFPRVSTLLSDWWILQRRLREIQPGAASLPSVPAPASLMMWSSTLSLLCPHFDPFPQNTLAHEKTHSYMDAADNRST